MPVIGCLLIIVLPLLGLAGGGLLAGAEGATWGAIAGFVIAVAVFGSGIFALIKATLRR